MIHQGVLMRQRLSELQEADKATTQRKLYKRKRVQEEGTLMAEDGIRMTTLEEFTVCSDGKKAKKRTHVEVGKPSQRRCGRCSKAGRNSRTYRQGAAIDFE
jgi:hypothetical protein